MDVAQEQNTEELKENLDYWFKHDHVDGIEGALLLAGLYPTDALRNYFTGHDSHLYSSIFQYGVILLDGRKIDERNIWEPVEINGTSFKPSYEQVEARAQALRDEFQPFSNKFRYIQKLWNSAANPAVTPLAYFVEWARKKEIAIEWEPLAIELGFVNPEHDLSDGKTESAFKSDKLQILNQAAFRFWAKADRNDRSTHPSKKDVMAWLMEKERGFSKKLADSASTIIRPEWAPTGKKPEK